MKFPLEIAFRDFDSTESLESKIREKAEKLEQYYDRITSCHVVVEAPHKHHHKGKLYHVRIDLHVPGKELVAGRDPSQKKEHSDVHIAIRDAFTAITRQLKSYAQQQRGEVKHHSQAV